ncbi:xanthine dehydrogenase family protein subunit M [Rhodovarius crocodyli]|uniref:Xanthine dehydrogenase family protein subunit M n=1 Tax=Rhodovarius crocodyli TaxID=1979269 RepID=A0A437M3P1_9PROT|nr:FAD binding domain-containing protein [Rhodovarius crocodyli]RVT92310.1 xanthine dehydrogenase family protein subunit M [Rhodovarius crocodyli]
MKPAAFAYHRPETRAEALALLAEHGEEAKIIAGGQSLVPAMNFRLARPPILIDINAVPGLDGVREEAGQLVIGARTRHATFEKPVTAGPLGTLLARVAANIAHTPIRSRGSWGGSVSHADPASEWCCVTRGLEAELVAESATGRRSIPAADFFQTIFTTALRPDELLAEIRLPLFGPDWHCGFAEYARRAGDFALAMAVVACRVEGGVIREARVGLGGIASTPVTSPEAVAALLGQAPSPALFAAAGAAGAAATDPDGDIHASGEYRQDLVKAMIRRALVQAFA